MIRPLFSPALLASALLLGGCASSMTGLDSSSNFTNCKASAIPGVSCQSMTGVNENYEAGNLPFQRGGLQVQPSASTGSTGSTAPPGQIGQPGRRAAEPVRETTPDYAPERLKRQKMSPQDMRAIHTGEPLRQSALVLRIWVAPFENEDGDLHDQAIFYTQVHTGRWLIDATQALIRSRYQPTYRMESVQGSQPPPNQPTSPVRPQSSSPSTIVPME